MTRWYGAALAPILFWWGTSARAADVATIGCVGTLLNQATANAISDDFQASLERVQSGLADPLAQKGSASDPAVRAEVDKAVLRCGELNGWTVAARAAASEYTLKKLALPLFEAAVLNDGLDPGQIARLSTGLSGWRGGEEGPLSEHEKNRRIAAAMSMRLLRAGISLQTPQQVRDVYALALWHVHLDDTRTDFIAA